MTEGLTQEELREAQNLEGLLRGLNPRRILLDHAPNHVHHFLNFTTNRIEQCFRVLVELEFLEMLPDWRMEYLPEDDRRRVLAEKCIEGIRAYDRHYRKQNRFDHQGKPCADYRSRWRSTR